MKKLFLLIAISSTGLLPGLNAFCRTESGILTFKQENKMSTETLTPEKKHVNVLGKNIAYVETGTGDPIIFLHGNPTSSYLWRNIIPYVSTLGRCIAPDLPGMGDSEKLSDPKSYTFEENSRYLDAFYEKLGITKKITFVVHDWGSALAFDWARRHPDAVKGIAFMEAVTLQYKWELMPPKGKEIFQALRSPAGEKMVLEQNSFIEVNIPLSHMKPLTQEEHDEYRRPFLVPGEGRRAMLSWARQLPFEGEPSTVTEITQKYVDWLKQSQLPKLYVEADPGMTLPDAKKFCNSLPNTTKVIVKGLHYPQEDSPVEVGTALSVWIQGLNLR
ncbi:MAG TPA: haloalkane dehalogenase [Puia sp.]